LFPGELKKLRPSPPFVLDGLELHARNSPKRYADDLRFIKCWGSLALWLIRRVLAETRRRRIGAQTSLFEHVPQHIWQKRFYDFNVWSNRKHVEKLRYMHRNPVKRGLVESPELWRWSSYCAYAFGEAGPVKVNEWQVLKMKIRPPAA